MCLNVPLEILLPVKVLNCAETRLHIRVHRSEPKVNCMNVVTNRIHKNVFELDI